MEAILNCLLSIQLALGPFALASELIRSCSSPPQVFDLSQAEVLKGRDLESGEMISLTFLPDSEPDSTAVIVFDSMCEVLFYPAYLCYLACPPLAQVADAIMEDYINCCDLPAPYVIEMDER